MIDQKRFDTFKEVYTRMLTRAVTEHPEEYRYPISDVPAVVNRMMTAIEHASYNKDGYALRWTCRELGIKWTYGSINGYLHGYDNA